MFGLSFKCICCLIQGLLPIYNKTMLVSSNMPWDIYSVFSTFHIWEELEQKWKHILTLSHLYFRPIFRNYTLSVTPHVVSWKKFAQLSASEKSNWDIWVNNQVTNLKGMKINPMIFETNAWTVKIGESSGPRGPLPGSTTFSNFDGPGVSFKNHWFYFHPHPLPGSSTINRGPLPKSCFSRDTTGRNQINFPS